MSAISDKQIILVTGGSGMVGRNLKDLVDSLQTDVVLDKEQAIKELELHQDNKTLNKFIQAYFTDFQFLFLSSKDADLRDFKQTKELFNKYKPKYVIHLAAKVGGLFANMNEKVQFYEDNMNINLNVIKCAYDQGVKRMICALSTCIFPDQIQYPISEQDLHKGAPHSSNEGYAYAKRMCEVHCRLSNEQFKTEYLCVVPTNLYGKYDQYDPKKSHVVPALIRKAYEAKQNNQPFIVLGTGKPLRQFCFTPDLCSLILWVLFRKECIPLISLVPEEENSISILAETICQIMGVSNIQYDSTQADGQFRKPMSNGLLKQHLQNFKFTDLYQGLKQTIDDFKLYPKL